MLRSGLRAQSGQNTNDLMSDDDEQRQRLEEEVRGWDYALSYDVSLEFVTEFQLALGQAVSQLKETPSEWISSLLQRRTVESVRRALQVFERSAFQDTVDLGLVGDALRVSYKALRSRLGPESPEPVVESQHTQALLDTVSSQNRIDRIALPPEEFGSLGETLRRTCNEKSPMTLSMWANRGPEIKACFHAPILGWSEDFGKNEKTVWMGSHVITFFME
jgi:hypothetical protein